MADNPILPRLALEVCDGGLGEFPEIGEHSFFHLAQPVLHIASSLQPLQHTVQSYRITTSYEELRVLSEFIL